MPPNNPYSSHFPRESEPGPGSLSGGTQQSAPPQPNVNQFFQPKQYPGPLYRAQADPRRWYFQQASQPQYAAPHPQMFATPQYDPAPRSRPKAKLVGIILAAVVALAAGIGAFIFYIMSSVETTDNANQTTLASKIELSEYTSHDAKFRMLVPAGWSQPEETSNKNVFALYSVVEAEELTDIGRESVSLKVALHQEVDPGKQFTSKQQFMAKMKADTVAAIKTGTEKTAEYNITEQLVVEEELTLSGFPAYKTVTKRSGNYYDDAINTLNTKVTIYVSNATTYKLEFEGPATYAAYSDAINEMVKSFEVVK